MPEDTDTPLIDTLAVMTAASVENTRLSERELMLVARRRPRVDRRAGRLVRVEHRPRL